MEDMESVNLLGVRVTHRNVLLGLLSICQQSLLMIVAQMEFAHVLFKEDINLMVSVNKDQVDLESILSTALIIHMVNTHLQILKVNSKKNGETSVNSTH